MKPSLADGYTTGELMVLHGLAVTLGLTPGAARVFWEIWRSRRTLSAHEIAQRVNVASASVKVYVSHIRRGLLEDGLGGEYPEPIYSDDGGYRFTPNARVWLGNLLIRMGAEVASALPSEPRARAA